MTPEKPNGGRTSILIADSHPILREGLKTLIAHSLDMCVIAQASSGQEAVDLYREMLPDVALIDIRMPRMNGIETTRAIRAEFPNAKIVLLTNFDDSEDILMGLQAGAKSFLSKNTSRAVLMRTIHTVCSEQTTASIQSPEDPEHQEEEFKLTAREREVLKLMSQGMRNQEIADALFISHGTVKTHVNNILLKLGVTDRTKAVVTAIRHKLVDMS